MTAAHIHDVEVAARAAIAAQCPGFRAHGDIVRTETSLLLTGVLHNSKVIAKYPLDRRPFWLARAHHEITVYHALAILAPLPVTVPELVAADRTHHLIVMTDLSGPPVHPHRYITSPIRRELLDTVLNLLHRVHTWRPAPPSALPSDDDYPVQLAAVRGSEINDLEYHNAVELATDVASRLTVEIQHGDAHLGNVIHLPEGQLALIDLEFTAWRLPGYDLAKLWVLFGDTADTREQLIARIGAVLDRHAAFWCVALLVCLREITSQRRAPPNATRRQRLRRLRHDLALTLHYVQTYHRQLT